MAQQPIELILARQLASHLLVPVVIVGPDGRLLFFNEPAEEMLGLRFDEAGELPMAEWTQRIVAVDGDGNALDITQRPLVTAVLEGTPIHRTLDLRVADGSVRQVSVTAIPIAGLSGPRLGSMALLWETIG